MAKLEQQSPIPSLGSGILYPALQNRFRVQFPTLLASDGTDDRDILAVQLVSCKLNFLKKTVTLKLEMPLVHGAVQSLIQQMVQDPDVLLLDILDGASTVSQTLTIHLKKCLEHQLDFDYAESGVVFHHLVFEYKNFVAADAV